MKIQITQPIDSTSLEDINYLIEQMQKHNSIITAMINIEHTNYPTLQIGRGGNHIWVKQSNYVNNVLIITEN